MFTSKTQHQELIFTPRKANNIVKWLMFLSHLSFVDNSLLTIHKMFKRAMTF